MRAPGCSGRVPHPTAHANGAGSGIGQKIPAGLSPRCDALPDLRCGRAADRDRWRSPCRQANGQRSRALPPAQPTRTQALGTRQSRSGPSFASLPCRSDRRHCTHVPRSIGVSATAQQSPHGCPRPLPSARGRSKRPRASARPLCCSGWLQHHGAATMLRPTFATLCNAQIVLGRSHLRSPSKSRLYNMSWRVPGAKSHNRTLF